MVKHETYNKNKVKEQRFILKCIVNLSGRIKLAVTADTYVKLNEVL